MITAKEASTLSGSMTEYDKLWRLLENKIYEYSLDGQHSITIYPDYQRSSEDDGYSRICFYSSKDDIERVKLNLQQLGYSTEFIFGNLIVKW